MFYLDVIVPKRGIMGMILNHQGVNDDGTIYFNY